MKLTDKEYSLLLQLYHEMHEVFIMLPAFVLGAFYERLYMKQTLESLK